ncbi:MAG: hypothetical protein V3S14_14910 [Anaerolineae bacterium]
MGRLIWQRFAPQYTDRALWSLVLGVVLYVLVRSIPWQGGLIGLLVTLAGLGAMWLLFREKRRAPEVA